MKKNKLYILILIPLALAMTSFNVETQIERRSIELAQSSDNPVEAIPESPEAKSTEPPAGITNTAENIRDILSRMPDEINIDTNNDKEDDTTLQVIKIEESPQTSGFSISPGADNTRNQGKIIITINTFTEANLEAVPGMPCDCDSQQSIRLEVILAEGQSLESLTPDDLKTLLKQNSGVIFEKVNQERRSQHEQRLAEKDCDRKENNREKLNCLIDRVKESSGDEKEEFVAEIEDQMRDLLYSEEDSDQRTFDAIFRKLKSDRALTALKTKLEKHKDIKEEVDEYKEASTHFANEMREHNLAYEESLDMIANIERNGFRYPQDWANYDAAVQNGDTAKRLLFQAQLGLNRTTTDFRSEFDRITTRHSSGLSPRDIQIARNYAFPRANNSRGRSANVRGRVASQSPLGARSPLIGDQSIDYLRGNSYNGLQGSPQRFNSSLYSTRGRFGSNNPTALNGRINGRGRSMRSGNQFRYDRYDTLPQPRNLYIDRRQPSRGRGIGGRISI